MINKNKKRGFSLIELILVLAISSLAFIGLINAEKKRAEVQDAQNTGAKYEEIGKALSDYMQRNNANIRLQLTAAGMESPALAMTLLTTNVGTTSGYQNTAILPPTYNNTGPYGTTIQIYFKRFTVGTSDIIRGLVISSAPLVDQTGAVRYDYMGAAVKRMGPQGGMIFPAANTMRGQGGTWTLTNAAATGFSQITTLGKLGYRVQFQGDSDGTYLRLDGTSTMLGDLNMGNFSVNNATDINYNGWIYGNNALFNNIITGNITNTGNIATRTIVGDTTTDRSAQAAVAGVAAADTPYANFNTLFTSCVNCGFNGVAKATPTNFNAANGDIQIGSTGGSTANQGKLYVKDIVLGNGSSKGAIANANLSDRLPRYADRGIVLVNQDQVLAAPAVVNIGPPLNAPPVAGYACNWTGVGIRPVAKIELVPASMYVQGRVLGNIAVAVNTNGGLPPGYYVVQDQYTVSSLKVRAIATMSGPDIASWQVKIETPVYNPAFVGGQALAHIYCDYGV